MYANGFCPTGANGVKLPCPDGYGAILGTAAVCSLIEILISFIPPKIMLRIFPPIVTGPTVLLIGVHLIETGVRALVRLLDTCVGCILTKPWVAVQELERWERPLLRPNSYGLLR